MENKWVCTNYMMSGRTMNTNDESFAISYLEKISCYAGFFIVVRNILKGLQSFRKCFERKIGKSHKSTYFISWSMCQSSDSVGLFKFHQFTSFISVIIPCVIFNFLHFSWKNRWFSTISFQKITRFFFSSWNHIPGMLIDLQGPWGNSLNDNW